MLKDKVALVTGASRGIGKEIALTLAGRGATVIVNYNGSKDAAEAVVAQIRENGGQAEAWQCNVGDFNASKEMITAVIKKYGHLDILLNNAGITKSGRIINLASVVGRSGNAGQMNYAASKAGIIGMTMSAAKELASRGITVNAVAPGFIRTEMTDAMTEDAKNAVTQLIPMGVPGETKDVAELVAFLASDAARYITGQTISVDGGMYMG